MMKKLLVGFDGSQASHRAFATALDLAAHYGSELHLCSVIENLPRFAETMGELDEWADHGRRHFELEQRPLIDYAQKKGVAVVPYIEAGHPVEILVRVASEQQVDCIVLGGLGHSHVLHRASGGTGTQIAYHATCSVFIVRS